MLCLLLVQHSGLTISAINNLENPAFMQDDPPDDDDLSDMLGDALTTPLNMYGDE